MNFKEKLEQYIFTKSEKIKINSNDIKKGDVFIALQGNNVHGNKYINSAIKNGAKYCISSKQDKKIKNNKVIFVRDLIYYLESLAINKRSEYNGKVVGITGSAGKTTLKETLTFFLKKIYKVSYSKKSFNNQLGVIISLLNMDLKSKFSIFELGTNNFGEIKYLTNIIKPNQIFITNIQSTHLENFKNKKNIAKEKSDIFSSKYNKLREKLYLLPNILEEKLIARKALRDKNLKTIILGPNSKKYFIKKVNKNKSYYNFEISIKNKVLKIQDKYFVNSKLINILFCLTFFSENSIDSKYIIENYKYLKEVEGRGLRHTIKIKNKKFHLIDESYNANPDTMIQSIEYFSEINYPYEKKILILGNMNELGKISNIMHLNILKKIEKFKFKMIILCGEFYRTNISKLAKPKNKYIFIENQNEIMKFVYSKIHNLDMILIKCSNSTEVNKFSKEILKLKVGRS